MTIYDRLNGILRQDFPYGNERENVAEKQGQERHSGRTAKGSTVDLSKEAQAKRRKEATEKRFGYKEEEIVALYLSGKSIPAIEEICGISSSPISRVLKKYNVPMRTIKDYSREGSRKKRNTNIDEDEILRLYLSGLSKEKIGKKLNISQGPIDRVLKREKVQMRTIDDYRKKKK